MAFGLNHGLAAAATAVVTVFFTGQALAQIVPPYFEDFENEASCGTSCTGACVLSSPGWSNATTGDTTNWLAHPGSTPTGATGPDVDHTTGTATGTSLYVEATACQGRIAHLISPVFDLSAVTGWQATFWYHMLGATMGTIHVDVSIDGGLTFSELGVVAAFTDNEDAWQLQFVDLAAYAGQAAVVLRIVGTVGASSTSDMAIDDFALCAGSGSPVDVAVTAITPPPFACNLSAATTIQVELTNAASCGSTPASFDVEYTVDGGAPVVETYSGGPIVPGRSAIHTFTTIANPGAVPFSVEGASLLVGDVNVLNDSLTQVVNHAGDTLATFPSLEDFESASPPWFSGIETGTRNTWGFGTPAKAVIIGAASGSNAWVTGGLTGRYDIDEHSFIQTYCGYDMTSLTSPAVSLSVWWQTEFSWDGAQLQSSIDSGASWQTIGLSGEPVRWYTDNTIVGLPDGIGWSGRTSTNNGSNGWVTAGHSIASLAGESSVLLRVRFGLDGSVIDDGVAIDDVEVFENLPGVSFRNVGPALTPDGTAAGLTDVLVQTLVLRATGSADALVNSVTVTQAGNIADAEIVSAHLWLDDGDKIFDSAIDTQVGSQPFAGGVAVFDTSGALTLPLFIRATLFVSFDLSPVATQGATFGSRISSVSDVVVQSGIPATFVFTPMEGPLFSVFGHGTVPYFEDFDVSEVANLTRQSGAGLTYPQAANAGDPPVPSAPTSNDASVVISREVPVTGFGTVLPSSAPNMVTLAFPNGPATGSFDLLFDMGGMSVASDDVWLGFDWNNANQEDHVEDNVLISTDGGVTWVTSLYNFTAPVSPAWGRVLLDVSLALASAAADYTSNVVIRFQAAGDTALGNDGLIIDDVFLGRAMQLQLERPNATLIIDNGNDDAGNVLLGAQSLTYTVTNLGDLPLDITAASFASANSVNVTDVVITPPVVNPVPPLGTTSVQVDFTVPVAAAFGFDVSFAVDDPRLGDSEFNLAVVGNGTEPEVDVLGPLGSSVANHGSYELGVSTPGTTQTLTYTIENLGSADLHLTGTPLVAIADPANVTATVTTAPSALVAPAANDTFDVELTPLSDGSFSFDVVITSDDADEDPYTITVSGTATTEMAGTGGTGAGTGGTGIGGTGTGGTGIGGTGASGGEGGYTPGGTSAGGRSGDGPYAVIPRPFIVSEDNNTCACRLPGSPKDMPWAPPLALGFLALAVLRRRQSRGISG